MTRLGATALITLALAGCGARFVSHETPPTSPDTEPDAAAPGITERLVEVFVPRRCARVNAATLKPLQKADGVAADAVDLATARGDQVDQLQARIANIAAGIKRRGCVELTP